MKKIARLTDIAQGTCSNHVRTINVTGIIAVGSPVCDVAGLPAARLGDIVTFNCGHTGVIASGASVGFCDNRPLAGLGDIVTGPGINAIIVSSCANVTSA